MHPLRAWRTDRGLSLSEAAEVLETTKATVSRWESGDRKIDFSRVTDISAATGIPAHQLRPDLAGLFTTPVKPRRRPSAGRARSRAVA